MIDEYNPEIKTSLCCFLQQYENKEVSIDIDTSVYDEEGRIYFDVFKYSEKEDTMKKIDSAWFYKELDYLEDIINLSGINVNIEGVY